MERFSVALPSHVRIALDKEARSAGIQTGEYIRRILDERILDDCRSFDVSRQGFLRAIVRMLSSPKNAAIARVEIGSTIRALQQLEEIDNG